MSEHIVENNPKREFMFALGGVGLFLAIVLLIGVSGFLRPAGEHITAKTAEEAVPVATAEAPAAEASATETAKAPTASADSTAEATVEPAEADKAAAAQ